MSEIQYFCSSCYGVLSVRGKVGVCRRCGKQHDMVEELKGSIFEAVNVRELNGVLGEIERLTNGEFGQYLSQEEHVACLLAEDELKAIRHRMWAAIRRLALDINEGRL